jgi:hypothetical protein
MQKSIWGVNIGISQDRETFNFQRETGKNKYGIGAIYTIYTKSEISYKVTGNSAYQMSLSLEYFNIFLVLPLRPLW